MKVRHRTGALIATCLLWSSVAIVGTGVAHADDETAATAGELQGTTSPLDEGEIQLLESNAPKRVVVDPRTGDVTAVEPLTASEVTALVQPKMGTFSATAGCSSVTKPCWHSQAPAQVYSFTTGTTNGTWGHRKNFWTGDYYAKLCWLDPLWSDPLRPAPSVCMPLRNGKNAWIEIGFVVVGKQVNVSTTR